ncbi:hypothetical protein [Pseudonocardia xinjiangensis]|uniref:ABC-2 family transporter n=1 Tax=Pseudonocardia xinjiangensis TaxID=75289 RepID=A0ABX1RCB1_9PSEU|nr:hypothetical protein [Pseudonocardia xinjiangensis]NMH78018.1 hypothetical protein [Pseudonocardia xinjiangensis]
MTWLVWRRQRAALLLCAALLGGTALVLVAARLLLTGAAAELGVTACLTDRAVDCTDGGRRYELYQSFRGFQGPARAWLWVLAPIVGMIAGAGLFAREFEQRTQVFALTQATSRTRWWATGIAVTLVPVLVAVAGLTLVASWALAPFAVLYEHYRIEPVDFDLSGVLPVGSALLAFAIAAAAGLLLRNSLATIVVTVLGWTLIFFVVLYDRYDYLPAETTTTPLTDTWRGWDGDTGPGTLPRDFGFLDAAGNRIDLTTFYRHCPVPTDMRVCAPTIGAVSVYRDYQPDSNYWPLQGITTAIMIVLSALTLAAGKLRLRRVV